MRKKHNVKPEEDFDDNPQENMQEITSHYEPVVKDLWLHSVTKTGRINSYTFDEL